MGALSAASATTISPWSVSMATRGTAGCESTGLAAKTPAAASSVRRRMADPIMTSPFDKQSSLYGAPDRRYQTARPHDRRYRNPRPHVYARRAGVDAHGPDDRLLAGRGRCDHRHDRDAAHRRPARRLGPLRLGDDGLPAHLNGDGSNLGQAVRPARAKARADRRCRDLPGG